MGQLVPEGFPLELLKNEAERRVVTAFVDTLYSSWLVIPDVGMRAESRDHQTDIVLVHPDHGVLLVEVKGHRVKVKEGMWCGNEGTPLEPQPVTQALNNSYELQRRLRRLGNGLEHLVVTYGLAFPNTREVMGDLPMDIDRDQLLLSADLLDANDGIERLAELGRRRAYIGALSPEQIQAIVAAVRPDTDFRWDPDARANTTRQRLDEYCDAQITGLISLMENRRVAVRGGAGTGKTRLAVKWATAARNEGDRVLLTCFNEPLADMFTERIGELADDDTLMVGAFLKLARAFPGIPPLEMAPGTEGEVWETNVWGHLQRNWPNVTEQFDTIVIDEAQDFSPAWIGMIESMLDPDGRRRILMVADTDQGIYGRGFKLPRADDGWVQAELVTNYRNALPIARILRRKLGGAASPAYVPEGLGVAFHPVEDVEEAVLAVDEELDRIVARELRDPKRVCVATFRSSVRTALRDRLGLGSWEERDQLIVCENVHRLKGLEFDTVILVAAEPADPSLLYVGVSRAVSELIVVGPSEVGKALGL